jgi:hypothetical protein
MFIITRITGFLPHATKRLLVAWGLVPGVAAIIVSMAEDEPYEPWDPYGNWRMPPCPQEFDIDGNYGMLPMTSVGLPLF